MANKPSKPNPADPATTEEVPVKTGPVPKSTETMDNGAIVETF